MCIIVRLRWECVSAYDNAFSLSLHLYMETLDQCRGAVYQVAEMLMNRATGRGSEHKIRRARYRRKMINERDLA